MSRLEKTIPGEPDEYDDLIGVRDPRTGLFCSWARELDWAWTPEETSSVAGVAAAVTRGGPKTKSFVFRRMWTISGRRRRHFDRTDLARLFLTRKTNDFSTFWWSGHPRGVWKP